MKICFVDTETTGAEPAEDYSIFEIACILDIDGKFESRFCMNARPIDGQKIDPEALQTTRKTEEEIRSYKNSQKDLYECFYEWCGSHVDPFNKKDKMHFCGYNSGFDMNHVRELFNRHKNIYFGSLFWFPDIDVMRVAAWALMKERTKLSNFKLYTVAGAMGLDVKVGNFHNAMYDTRVVRQMYYYLEGK